MSTNLKYSGIVAINKISKMENRIMDKYLKWSMPQQWREMLKQIERWLLSHNEADMLAQLCSLFDKYAAMGNLITFVKSESDWPIDAYLKLGLFFQRYQHYQQAAWCFRKQILADPRTIKAAQSLNLIIQRLNSKGIKECYRALRKIDPADLSAQQTIQKMPFQELKKRLEIECFTKILEIDPHAKKECLQLGQRLISLNQTQKAINVFSEAIKFNTDFSEAYFRLVCIFVNLSKLQIAAQLVTKQFESQKEQQLPVFFVYDPSVISFYQEHIHVAIKCYKRIVDEIHPTHPAAYLRLGKFLSMIFRHKEAIPYCQKGVELAPTNAVSYLLLGRSYNVIRLYSEAEKCYKKAFQLNPHILQEAPDYLIRLAQCLQNVNNYKQAMVYYQRFLKLHPSEHVEAKIQKLKNMK